MKVVVAFILGFLLVPTNILASFIRNKFETWDDDVVEDFDKCPLNTSDSILVIKGIELGIGKMRNITISRSTKTIRDDLNPENGPYTKVCIGRDQSSTSRGHILRVDHPKSWLDLAQVGDPNSKVGDRDSTIYSEKKILGTSKFQKYPWFDSNHRHDDGSTT